jgi:hypothetical protein
MATIASVFVKVNAIPVTISFPLLSSVPKVTNSPACNLVNPEILATPSANAVTKPTSFQSILLESTLFAGDSKSQSNSTIFYYSLFFRLL